MQPNHYPANRDSKHEVHESELKIFHVRLFKRNYNPFLRKDDPQEWIQKFRTEREVKQLEEHAKGPLGIDEVTILHDPRLIDDVEDYKAQFEPKKSQEDPVGNVSDPPRKAFVKKSNKNKA